jgi:hypothetical protein
MNETIEQSTTARLVESRTREAQYGFSCREAIIEHPTMGRLWIGQNWGSDGLNGKLILWKYGVVVKLIPTDSFATLDNAVNEYGMTTLHRASHAADPARPLLHWLGGPWIERVAESLGL